MAKPKKGAKVNNPNRKSRNLKILQTIADLQKRIDEYDPATDEQSVSQFKHLPISQETYKGLLENNFVSLTDIQKKAIPVALKSEDVMGTARTGSGKTLAFLVPVIEKLIRENITEYDGLAALIVSPTRELAVQTFEVLTKIGKYNSFSAGLVTGGKDVKYEKERISRMNILIGTPGRISQHLNEAVGMETSNLQVLVLDEADRCLDMGFRKQIDNILGHLPVTRQTLLFSATQSDNVKDLARLSLVNPKRVGVSSDQEVSSIPESLEQYYINISLASKMDVLWSFLKSHLKSKILVFFSSSKQVQFAYEAFRRLQPGISLLKLYGRHKQTSRLETTMKFSRAQHACLFATDIVARGLDFPAIDWVVQVDCPEDAATYVHRVGRAARFGRQGKSLLMLAPSEEEGMVKRLEAHKISLKMMNIKQKNKKVIAPQLQSLCFQDPELKNLGQRAFISYMKSVHIQKDKDIFKVEELPAAEYAKALGLPGTPNINIKNGAGNKDKKNMSRELLALQKPEKQNPDSEKVRTKYDRMFERQNQTVLSKNYLNMAAGDESGSEDDFMSVKRKDHVIRDEELPDLSVPVSKRQSKKALSKKASLKLKGNPTKLVFDDDGVAHHLYEFEDEEDFKLRGDAKLQKAEFVSKENEAMSKADVDDKATAREKRQEKKRRWKEQERLAREQDEFSGTEDEAQTVTLGGADIDRDMDYGRSSDDEQPPSKKPKWFEQEKPKKKKDDIVEVEEPETLEDLEALTAKLIGS
jgi:ATP-dependent RNA helicase DDX10/DBP4